MAKLKNKIIQLLVVVGKPFYYIFYFLGSFLVFSHEEIIYRARDFRKKRKPKEFKIKISFTRRFKFGTGIKILFGFILIIFIMGAITWYFVFRDLPTPNELVERKIDVSTRIYDRNGILLYQVYKDQNRTLVNFSDIPENIKLATIATEDANFYSEHGFSLKGMIRALIADIANKDFGAGGSTITQQLVKNTLLTSEKTFIRKIKELVVSIEVDQHFSKEKILEMYLNEVPYGGSAYGIEAASQQYFGKDVNKLDLAEAALLAGLPKSPTIFSPFGENPELAIGRQRQVLQLMVDNGFITKDQKTQAESEKLQFATSRIDIKAPHFVMYVRQILVNQYGEEKVQSGGLNVTTTLDYNIQQMAQEIVHEQVDKLKGFHVTNGAAVVMDANTGEILAMVGSKDYFDISNDGNVNLTTALRPPGSSIKIVNYAYALSHGFTPATILQDIPVVFKSIGSPFYSPVNYDGKFVGNITLRNALAQSRNIPAVKILASYGVDNMINLGQKMGITTWNEKNTYGLSLTLGGGATKLIELARVYATVANYGDRPPIRSVLKVDDYRGVNLPIDCDTNDCKQENVLDPRVSFQLIDILRDNNARAAEFGEHSSLFLSNHPEIAVKTGTSNDLRDNLTIGFNQKYLTATWVGNNDNSPMSRIASGITGAAPIWNEIMTRLVAQEKSIVWNIPSGLKQIPCRGKNEFFLNETNTKNLCNIKEGPVSGQIVNN